MFGPKVVDSPYKDGLYVVKKLTLLGWRYLDLWDFKSWRRQRVGQYAFWTRCCAGRDRAVMAMTLNRWGV